jgi:hypothetical protein
LNLGLISEHLQKKSAQKLPPKKFGGFSKSATAEYLFNDSIITVFWQFLPIFFRKWSESSVE